MANKELWKEYNGKGFSAEYAGYSERASRDEDGNDIVETYATKNELPGTMSGATSQAAGSSGLVPAPAAGDDGKFLKGDGTWDSPPEVNLDKYYYDINSNGLSAARRNSGIQGSLVGTSGNANSNNISAQFSLSWGGIVHNLINVDSTDPNSSSWAFGTGYNKGARYMLPPPSSGSVKYAVNKADGKIYWDTIPSASPSASGVGGTDGLMTATDKEKLDGAKSFSTVKVTDGDVSATLPANSLNEEIELVAGDNVTLEAGLVIGGRQYKTVKIGNQVWMAENLDFLPDGIELHNEFDLTPAQSDFYEPVAWYYNFDETTAKERNYGLLYNSEAADYLEAHKSTLFPGWHVPTQAELATLAATATRDSLRQSVSWAGGDWHNEYCTNTTGFSAIPNGNVERQWRSTLPYFYRNGTGMGFWTITDVMYTSGIEARRYYGNLTGYNYFTADSDTYKVGEARAIRLIKDDSVLPNKVRISSDAALEKSIYGTYIAGEQGEGIEGESGLLSLGKNSVELYDTFKGVKFGAERAVADREGNIIDETYAKTSDVTAALSGYATKFVPDTKTAAASVTVDNNKVTSITGVTGSIAIDISVASGECANTAVEITTGTVAADSAVTVTVNSTAASRAAVTDGKIESNKKYQVVCVGTCWTMAEFATST